MSCSHPLRWLALCMFAALTAFGCVGSDTGESGESGSLSLDLVIGDGIEINEVEWRITGNGMDMSGTIDVSAPGATASVEVFGLPPGDEDYTVTLTATSEDGEVTCSGSADFNVEVGQATDVMVVLNCKLPEVLGGVRVNGKFNICAQLTKATAAPLRTSVGNDIDLTSQATDADGDAVAYTWTATGGSIDDASAANTTYTCQEAGAQSITISVTDNDDYCDMATWTFPVFCVPTDAECQSDEDCEAGEVCLDGQCVPDVECVTPADCDDQNDCTANICADGVCENPNRDADEMCDQNGGSVCDGEGSCVECNLDIQCDAGEVCTDNACVPEAECSIDGECDDENDCTVDLCTEGECSNENDEPGAVCDQGGGSVCDGQGNCVECNGDSDCDMGEVCTNNECVLDVECRINDDCGIDEICVDNACVSDPEGFCDEGLCATNLTARADCVETFLTCLAAEPANEEECVAAALLVCAQDCIFDDDCDMGEVCVEQSPGLNECVPEAECIVDADCDDGNDCTEDICNDGDFVCLNPPSDADTACDQGGGSFCDGAGACVECNGASQCPGDGECQAPACESNACTLNDVQNGTPCDGGAGTCMAGVCEPVAEVVYEQSFESLDKADPAALTNDGWLFFGAVFDSGGGFLFPYGPGGAPNGGPGFSAIDMGQGGATQGMQQLSIYSDYNCCQPSNGHFNGTDMVESSVFQEPYPNIPGQRIPAELIGKTLTFSFDAKRGNINNPSDVECMAPNGPCDSTALAYIQTLDPTANFNRTNFVDIDMTNLSTDWARFEISLDLTDPALEGQILQFGFRTIANSFEPSGNFYDNILTTLTEASVP